MSIDLATPIEAGDAARVVEILAPLTEPDRRALAPYAIDAYRKMKKERSVTWDAPTHQRYKAATLAVLGTATLTEIRQLSHSAHDDLAYDVLSARRPSWLTNWCEWTLRAEAADWRIANWKVVRRLVREGLCERPQSDMYYLLMAEWASRKSVRDFLLADPALLDFELWELFRIEGNANVSINGIDKYSRSKWMSTLVDMAADGTVSRDRLLDASLHALSYDFPQFRSGWFSRFHEALSPTLDERQVRLDRYLDLIASKIPPTVSFALTAVAVVDRAGMVSPDRGLKSIGPSFYADEKKTVALALKLVTRWVDKEQGLVSTALDIVSPALEHGARDAREAVSAFMALHGHHTVGAMATTEVSDTPMVPAPNVERQVVVPIDNVEELVEAFSSAIENEGPPDNLERVLDGVSRLCDQRPEGFERLSAPLRKRARSVIGDGLPLCFHGYSVKSIMCGLAIAWLDGEVATPSDRPPARGPSGFHGARVREIAAGVARKTAGPLLSSPTWSGGVIDPTALVERLRSVQPSTVDLDIIVALLRLGREGRAEALASAAGIRGEVGDAVRHALGADGVVIGSSAPLWSAAARARDPEHDDVRVAERHPGLGPDTALVGRIAFGWRHTESTVGSTTYFYHHANLDLTPNLPETRRMQYPTVLIYSNPSSDPPVMAWSATIWPIYRESWCAAGCLALGNNLDWWGAEWGNKTYLTALFDHDVRLNGLGGVLLSLALAAKDPTEGTLAVDALLGAISDGRLSASLLGDILARLFTWDHIKLPRVTTRLLQAARVSSTHADVIHASTVAALEAGPPAQSAALGTALELLFELSVLTKAPPPSGKLADFLAGIKGSNRASTLARRLLASPRP